LGTRGTHPYLATRPEAYSNLDIIRAVQSSDFPVADRVVLAGQSQGAGAAVATAAFSTQYAPDVDIAGVVATGVPFFSAEGLAAIQETRPPDRVDPMLAYNFLAMSLVQRTDPSFKLSEYVTPDVMPLVKSVRNTCHKNVRAKVLEDGLTYNRSFKKSPSAKLIQAFSLMEFPTLKFDAPLFVGTGGKDRDTPLRMQAAFVKRACQAGTPITAKLYPELDHKAVVPGSTADSLPFVKAAFAGEDLSGNCDNLPY
jgi:acetyl esterase/lipase